MKKLQQAGESGKTGALGLRENSCRGEELPAKRAMCAKALGWPGGGVLAVSPACSRCKSRRDRAH